MTLERVERLLPSLDALGTQVVLISGGEPLLNREWASIAALLRARGLSPWLLTSGLSLAKHARRAAALFDRITVSLDGAHSETYAAIRGVDAFDTVLAGIRAVSAAGTPAGIRVTLQRANYHELPAFIEVSRAAGAAQVSFLAVDVANSHAFARRDAGSPDVALRRADLPALARLIETTVRDCAEDFRSRFIAETPRKLGHILEYFTAVCGLGPHPPVRCNAPEFSAVIDAHGRVHPCFFIPGPATHRPGPATHPVPARPAEDGTARPAEEGGHDLARTLNDPAMAALRADIRASRRSECKACVCSMWRDPGTFGTERLLASAASAGSGSRPEAPP